MSDKLDVRLIEIGYFLSRVGIDGPPPQLKAYNWKEAYLKFYDAFGGNKTPDEFKNSLKNIRDHFDSHLDNNRSGWKGKDGKAQKLPSVNQDVYDRLSRLDVDNLWKYIRPLALLSYDSLLDKEQNVKILEAGGKYFSSEFSGSKKISKSSVTEATVTHGIVVDFLKEFAENNFDHSVIFNTQKIDLAIENKGEITSIFEVKTSGDTQSIYTAVGQLFMHSIGLSKVSKYIVLPECEIHIDTIECLKELNINIVWYLMKNEIFIFRLEPVSHDI